MSAKRARVVIVVSGFPPFFENGGPAVSLSNLTSTFGDEYEFLVITRLRGSLSESTAACPIDEWTHESNAQVCYSSSQFRMLKTLRETLGRQDVLHLNSLLSIGFFLLPLIVAGCGRRIERLVISPRGELDSGALRIKLWRKRAYLHGVKVGLRLFIGRRLTFHATTDQEAIRIGAMFGNSVNVVPAGNIPRMDLLQVPLKYSAAALGRSGVPVRIIYMSRIVPKKNLFGLILALGQVQQSHSRRILLQVVGSAPDPKYRSKIAHAVKGLSESVKVEFMGHRAPSELNGRLAQADLFVLPSFGENFGHAIWEALSSGRPVIVGNDVPWGRLTEGDAGRKIDPNDTHELSLAIAEFIGFSASQWKQFQLGARIYAEEYIATQAYSDAYARLYCNGTGRS